MQSLSKIKILSGIVRSKNSCCRALCRCSEQSSQQSGFSLLEAILAIGILSVVCIQIINVQSASMEIVAVSRANQLATWAMRSANAQLQYVLDVYGVEGLRPNAEFKAGPEKEFNVTVQTTETSIEASRLFITAMRMTKVLGGETTPANEDEKNSEENQYKQIGDALDAQVPKDIYRTVKIKVTWKLADTERSMDGGFLVVDDKALTIGQGLSALGGGGALNSDDSGNSDNDSDPNKPLPQAQPDSQGNKTSQQPGRSE